MSALVSTRKQALDNIQRFHTVELPADPILQDRAAYVRAWYGWQDDDGVWHFGPSKFIGYKGMTAAEYFAGGLDGRRTEKQLADWFTEVTEDDEFYEELSDALTDMLHTYGKVPSSAARINVSNEQYEAMTKTDSDDTTLADLLIAVAKRLSKVERARVRAAL